MAGFLSSPDTPVALTIATSDSGGGAGVQADLKTFAARRTFGTSVFCALTAQNPEAVNAIAELEVDFIEAQLETIFSFFNVRAAKTGMLFSAGNIEVVSRWFERHPAVPLVVDPVMVATSGAVLLQPEAIAALKERLLPRAQVVTPNLDEAAVLLGSRPEDPPSMREAAAELARRFHTAVLLKGGHLEGSPFVTDFLAMPGELEPFEFSHERIHGVNTHGSGCTLSAAIVAELAKGCLLAEAVRNALGYVETALRRPVQLNGDHYLGH